MKTLVIDIGGTNVKVASTDKRVPIKIASGPTMTATQMAQQVLAATEGWKYDCISIGYPGPVVHDHPLAEPHNLAPGWIDFPYQKTFGKPIRFINDAAMQALGGYRGGRMLFLGTGTGLGSAMVFDGIVIPLELAHLPYKKGRTYEEYIGLAGLELRGKKRWRNAIEGGIRLWQNPEELKILVNPSKNWPAKHPQNSRRHARPQTDNESRNATRTPIKAELCFNQSIPGNKGGTKSPLKPASTSSISPAPLRSALRSSPPRLRNPRHCPRSSRPSAPSPRSTASPRPSTPGSPPTAQ